MKTVYLAGSEWSHQGGTSREGGHMIKWLHWYQRNPVGISLVMVIGWELLLGMSLWNVGLLALVGFFLWLAVKPGPH